MGPNQVGAIEMSEGKQSAKRYVVFAVADLRLVAELDQVVRVTYAAEITPLQGVAECVAGSVSLRGDPIPVIDMRRRLGLAPREMELTDQFLLVQRGVWRWFLLTDSVIGVVELSSGSLSRRGDDPLDCRSADIALEEGVVSLLDLGRLLNAEQAQQLQRALAERAGA